MPIYEKDLTFCLETKNTSYQMKVDAYGVLCHVWYGEKINQDMSYLLDYPDLGFAGRPEDAAHDKTFSKDSRAQEYSTFGVGDFRVSAISARHSDGSNALDLRYVDYEILDGKYTIPGLPHVYGESSTAQTLEITLKDTASDVSVVLKYGVFFEADVITRSVSVINRGQRAVTLQRAHSVCLDIPYGDWQWIHFPGRHTAERQVQRLDLLDGIQQIGSLRGTSSHQHNPAVMICRPDCTEDRGFCLGAVLVYSGGFQMQLEKDQLGQIRMVMGIAPETFCWELQPDGRFDTPEVILSCSTEGLAKLSHNYHNIIRKHLCRGKYQTAERPLLINNWEATYFDFNEEKLLKIAAQAGKLGVDMLVLDDGWFGKRNSDNSSLGDWYPNTEKLPNGLGSLAEKINGLGMKLGLWFEPEMISENSRLYEQHPQWMLRAPGRAPERSRDQFVLDMSREDVQNYLHDTISGILRSANISYIKWDMNRSISDAYSQLLPAHRQGELHHRYMLGLYSLLERLTGAFPDVLFETCSGGGGRFDAGMLYYSPQIWCSDNTDAYARTQIQYGTSFIYPISAIGAHVSAVPNHQTGRITSLEARGTVAMAGTFGYELDLNTLSQEEKDVAAEQIKQFKRHRHLIHNGAYYRLSNPQTQELAAWQFVSEDGAQVLVQGLQLRSTSNAMRTNLRLFGLDPEGCYILEGDSANNRYTGAALMYGGILLPKRWGDNQPFQYYFIKK